MRPLWKSRAHHKVAKGGRGSGKSWDVAERFMTLALREQCKILCTRDVQNTLSDSVLATLKRVIEHHGLEEAFEQTRHGLRCKNGSLFLFRGLQDPHNIKSLENVKYCWVEEAQRVSRSAMDILMPTIRADGSEIWWVYNPENESDPVHQEFAIGERPDCEVVTCNWRDNPYFPDVLKAELEYDRGNDYEKYLWVWEGHTRTISDAQVFRHKFRVAEFQTPQDARFYYGADWGFSQDPTALVRCFIRNKVLWIDYEAYGTGVDIDQLPALFRAVPGSDTWPIIADSERPDTISYMRKHDYNIRGAKKGKGSVEDGVQFIRSFRGVVIHPRCEHTAEEFRTYSYKTDRITEEILPVLEDKNNHAIDALRYALEATMRRVGSIGSVAAAELGL